MGNKTIEAYRYYKENDAPLFIFFRIGNQYKAYFDDARIISETLNIPLEDESISVQVDQILDVVGALFTSGIECKIISYRNANFEYSIPDVESLRSEKELDKDL